VLITVITACAGGGSDDGGTTQPTVANKAPTANAGSDINIDEGSTVSLTGSGTDSDGTISSYSWSQTSGISVTIEKVIKATRHTMPFEFRVIFIES